MTAIDHAAIGRVYADNLLGEPAVSRCLHAMADEIERLQGGGACPHVRGTVTQHCSLNFTLTETEREAIEWAMEEASTCRFATLRKLLERLK
jgi:hypothetical protein